MNCVKRQELPRGRGAVQILIIIIIVIKRNQAIETKCTRKHLRIFYLEHKTNDRVQSKINFLVGLPEPLLSKDGNLHGSSMSHAMAASLNPSFRASWRVGAAVVSRGNAGWTISNCGYPCPCQRCSQGPPAEKTGRGSLLNHPSCPYDDSIGQGTKLN